MLFTQLKPTSYGDRTKNTLILTTVVILSFIYIINEVKELSIFDRLETLLRQTLFIICFFYLFRHLNVVVKRKISYYSLLALGCSIEVVMLVSTVVMVIWSNDCMRKIKSELDALENNSGSTYDRILLFHRPKLD